LHAEARRAQRRRRAAGGYKLEPQFRKQDFAEADALPGASEIGVENYLSFIINSFTTLSIDMFTI